jgi:pimeloyl-ACP methyl ester carboxylesterase
MIQDIAAGTAYLHRPGQGIPMVLLHGIGSDARSWEAMMAQLSPGIAALAWWAPGYGGSTPVAEATPAAYAARLGALLDALDMPRVVLAGHSLGALFAGAFAVAYPDRVAALALLSPALGYRVVPGDALPEGVQARMDELAALGPEVFAAKRATRLLHAPERHPEILAGVQRAMASVNPPGYAQACHALGAGDLLADARNFAMPAKILVGAEDVVTPPANAMALYEAAPSGSTIELVPEAGHALPQQAPALVAARLAVLMPVRADA